MKIIKEYENKEDGLKATVIQREDGRFQVHFADTDANETIGSRVWPIRNIKETQTNLQLAHDYAKLLVST